MEAVAHSRGAQRSGEDYKRTARPFALKIIIIYNDIVVVLRHFLAKMRYLREHELELMAASVVTNAKTGRL